MAVPRLGLKLHNHRRSVPGQATGLGRQMRHTQKRAAPSTEVCGRRQMGHLLGSRESASHHPDPCARDTFMYEHASNSPWVCMHEHLCQGTSFCTCTFSGQWQRPRLGKGCQETQTLSASHLNPHSLSYTTAEAEREGRLPQSDA